MTSILERMAAAEIVDEREVERPALTQSTGAWLRRERRNFDATRLQLGSDDPQVRIRALRYLGHFGTLDDVGLLWNLLALPERPDEHPEERMTMVWAMQHIAGVTKSRFNAVQGSACWPYVPFGPRRSPAPDWACVLCGTSVPATFDICWACGASSDGVRRERNH